MRHEMSLPPIFERYCELVSYVQRESDLRYRSTCPICGGTVHQDGEWPDRCIWYMDDPPRGWCSHCDKMFWPNMSKIPDKNVIVKWRKEQEQREQERKERAERALEHLRSERIWEQYHRQLDEAARKIWEKRGVPEELQNVWCLGYDPKHRFYKDSAPLFSPTLTIPIFGEGYDLLNVKHRLIHPPEKYSKYRYEYNLHNLAPGYLWRSMPDDSLEGQIVVVEGEIKAMVVARFVGLGLGLPVGLPGTNPGPQVMEQIKHAEHVYLIMDPDARKAAWDIVKEIGKEKCHVLIPSEREGKIDDWILKENPSERELRWIIRQKSKPAWI